MSKFIGRVIRFDTLIIPSLLVVVALSTASLLHALAGI